MSSPPKPVSLGRASLDGDLAKRAAAAVRAWNYVASGDTTAPDQPLKGDEVLRAKGWPEEIVPAILGHAHWGGVERDTPLAKTLFAVDELVGFVFACAYVQHRSASPT